MVVQLITRVLGAAWTPVSAAAVLQGHHPVPQTALDGQRVWPLWQDQHFHLVFGRFRVILSPGIEMQWCWRWFGFVAVDPVELRAVRIPRLVRAIRRGVGICPPLWEGLLTLYDPTPHTHSEPFEFPH